MKMTSVRLWRIIFGFRDEFRLRNPQFAKLPLKWPLRYIIHRTKWNFQFTYQAIRHPKGVELTNDNADAYF